MTILQVKLSEDQKQNLDRMATYAGMHPAEFIRTLLDLVEVKVERTRSPVRLHKRVLVQGKKGGAWSNI